MSAVRLPARCWSTGQPLPLRSPQLRAIRQTLIQLRRDRALDDPGLARARAALRRFRPLAVVRGRDRFCVVLRNGWVVKIYERLDDWAACDEFRGLARIAARDHHFLPEMYDLGFGVILQRRYVLSTPRFLARERTIRRVAQRLGIRDVRWANVGWRAGQFVFLDFADRTHPRAVRRAA